MDNGYFSVEFICGCNMCRAFPELLLTLTKSKSRNRGNKQPRKTKQNRDDENKGEGLVHHRTKNRVKRKTSLKIVA